MKCFFTCLLLFIVWYGHAQDDVWLKRADSTALYTVKLGFAVPDIPAFKAIGIDPSNILRPSEVKDFALMFSSFRSSGSTIIPKNLAVELAPGMIVKPWYNLNDYRTKPGIRFLTKSRISLGTNSEEETGKNSISVGFRTVLIDNADIRKDTRFMKEKLFPLLDKYRKSLDDIVEEVTAKIGVQAFAARQQELLDSIKLVVDSRSEETFDKQFAGLVSQYKVENWNAARMDLAYSIVLASPDTLLGNVTTDKHMFWWSFATRPGRNNHWGQLIFSFNAGLYQFDNDWQHEFTGNFRFYGGANRIKGFAEAQYQNRYSLDNNRFETLYIQVGAEANIFKGVWLHFGTGVMNALDGTSKEQLIGNLNVFLTLPEDFRLW